MALSHKKKKLYRAWSVVVMLIAVYAAVLIPYELAFKTELLENSSFRRFIDQLFVLDFLINLWRNRKMRLKRDCLDVQEKAWYKSLVLLSDLLAALPIGWVSPLSPLRLIKLFKLVRLNHIINEFRHGVVRYNGTITFIIFVFWFHLATHALACGWHSLQMQPAQDNQTNYVNALYWSITTITSVGYGDIVPETNLQKIYASFVQIIGFGVFTFMVGTVASSLMRKDPARQQYEENMEGLTGLLHYRELPGDLQNRIVDFYKYMWRRRWGYDETSFLQSLPENLQTEVALYLKNDLIEKVPLFRNATSEFKRQIALFLKPVFLTPGDYVFKAGDKGNKMYFVVSGELQTLTQDEQKLLTTLKGGDYFGEIALFKNQDRSATIKALSYCDIYSLDQESFEKVITRYPAIMGQISSTVERRESRYKM